MDRSHHRTSPDPPGIPARPAAGASDASAPSVADRVVEAALEAELATGRREESVEEARRSIVRRLGRIVAGSFLVLAGVVMMALPGPGLLTVAAGLLVLSRDFPWAARMLERVRARLPQDEQGQTQRSVVVASVSLAVLSIGGSLAFWLV